MLKFGDKNITKLYYGDKAISKAYLGEKLVFQAGDGGRFVTSILFDGASVVDTGLPHQTCYIECDIKFELTGERQLMGMGLGSAQYWGCGETGAFDYMNSNSNALKRNLVQINYDATDTSAPTMTVIADGYTRTSTGISVSSSTYEIGGYTGGYSTLRFPCTCEIWRNTCTIDGEIIQDLRPYVDADGVACFKDVVTNTIFYNKSTGTLGYTE